MWPGACRRDRDSGTHTAEASRILQLQCGPARVAGIKARASRPRRHALRRFDEARRASRRDQEPIFFVDAGERILASMRPGAIRRDQVCDATGDEWWEITLQ